MTGLSYFYITIYALYHMALTDYEYIKKQDIDNKTIKVLVPEVTEERKIKEATSLVDAALFEGSIAGDILVYEVYNDGHEEDVYGEYTVIPHEMKEYIELQKDNAIAICIGDGVFISLDEENQPWAGDVYTGLYNTNFAWDTTIHEILDDSTKVDATPWISENDGEENCKKIIWTIYDDIHKEQDPIEIQYTKGDLYQAVYDKIAAAGKYAWSERPENVIAKGDGPMVMLLLKESYKEFVYSVVEEGDYGISSVTLDYIFDLHNQKNTNKDYVDNNSLLWKEKVANDNYYINHNGDRIPIVVEYEYERIPDNKIGLVYVSDKMLYDPSTNLPTYSCSSNVFMYAKQYSTRGTLPGQWYLGSKEEMQNLMNFETQQKVNEILRFIGRKEIDTVDVPNYLTSSQAWYNTNYCYTIYTHYRYTAALDKRIVSHVRLVLNPEYTPVQQIEE